MRKTALALTFWIVFTAICPAAFAEEILVAAAASLTDALKEIGEAYRLKSGNRVVFSFAGSSTLARQIAEGAPADLFFSADREKMESLEKKQLIEPRSRKDLLSNTLVMVVPLGARARLKSPRDLLSPEIRRIALADPAAVPAGIYARQYLMAEGIWASVKGKVIPVLDVRAALASVEAGEVDAGFVYKTDAAISKKVRIAYEVPGEKGPKIVYPVAIVRSSRKKETARDFLRFLSSETAQRIFMKYGFIVLQ